MSKLILALLLFMDNSILAYPVCAQDLPLYTSTQLIKAVKEINIGTRMSVVEKKLGKPVYNPTDNIAYYDSNNTCYKDKTGSYPCGLTAYELKAVDRIIRKR